jgi:UDP-glucose 4-epimerase
MMNIAAGQRYSLNHVVALLRKIMGTDLEPIYGPPRSGDVLHAHADISLARQLLGYEPKVFLEEGLRRTVAWYRENPQAFSEPA